MEYEIEKCETVDVKMINDMMNMATVEIVVPNVEELGGVHIGCNV